MMIQAKSISPHYTHSGCYGFTLSELLIALAILGVIATFTIPKVLQAQADQEANAKAREVMSMISGAFQEAQRNSIITASTIPSDLTPYMNYVRVDTTSTIDHRPDQTGFTCSDSQKCLVLHNGSVLALRDSASFMGTTNLHAILFYFDPNGRQDYTTATDGPGKAVSIALYYNGFITTQGNVKPNTCITGNCTQQPSSALDPSWLQW